MVKMGRPTKLNPEVQKRICDAVSAGNYYEPASVYAGITYTTMRNWILRGEEAKSGIYFEFVEALTRAEATAEVRIVAQWQAQIPIDWHAARDFLERRYGDRWGRKEKQEVTGAKGGPLVIEVVYGDDGNSD